MKATTVTTVPDLKRVKGYLYFIDKDGDLARIKRAVGHYPGRSGKTIKVRQLKIAKTPGFLYYIDGKDRILSRPMHQFTTSSKGKA